MEVARWFFRVGGTAGTVAKTISAYDTAVGDALYGPTDRYVSRQRLLAMLEHEHAQLVEKLGPRRGDRSAFFVLANTVATRSYSRHENGHGWLGIRFQAEARSEPDQGTWSPSARPRVEVSIPVPGRASRSDHPDAGFT